MDGLGFRNSRSLLVLFSIAILLNFSSSVPCFGAETDLQGVSKAGKYLGDLPDIGAFEYASSESIDVPQGGFKANASNCTSYTISGGVETSPTVEVFCGSVSVGVTSVVGGAWSMVVDLSGFSDGQITLSARRQDGTTFASVNGNLDRAVPSSPEGLTVSVGQQ